jgi:hypothetical protein
MMQSLHTKAPPRHRNKALMLRKTLFPIYGSVSCIQWVRTLRCRRSRKIYCESGYSKLRGYSIESRGDLVTAGEGCLARAPVSGIVPTSRTLARDETQEINEGHSLGNHHKGRQAHSSDLAGAESGSEAVRSLLVCQIVRVMAQN